MGGGSGLESVNYRPCLGGLVITSPPAPNTRPLGHSASLRRSHVNPSSFSASKGPDAKLCHGGLPWWFSDKESPANARDTGSIPGPGRYHMPQGN